MKHNNMPIIDQNRQNGPFVIIQKVCFSYGVRDVSSQKEVKEQNLVCFNCKL